MTKTLFEEVRSEQNIFSAWRHMKRSALTSGNAEIRGKASEFEHAHQRWAIHCNKLQKQREGHWRSNPPVSFIIVI